MNDVRLKKTFSDSLGIPVEKVVDSLEYNAIEEWDSIGHMRLVAALDNEFDIMLETDDVLAMSSVGRAREILTKYGVEF
jgi:acyl carrier protein